MTASDYDGSVNMNDIYIRRIHMFIFQFFQALINTDTDLNTNLKKISKNRHLILYNLVAQMSPKYLFGFNVNKTIGKILYNRLSQ